MQLDNSWLNESTTLIEPSVTQDIRYVEDTATDNNISEIAFVSCDISPRIVSDFALHVEFIDFVTDLLHGEAQNLVLDF
ncbi:hypothetical protein C5C18_15040 [Rathayibacter tritici]|nr:hypothetical protein C5C21_15040 [Rathayibacter tritici]PPG01812.1 hypothetical protein C5C18_15040 [Rathayibacter tritici]